MRVKLRSITVILCLFVLMSASCGRPTAKQQIRQLSVATDALNINTATAEELTAIPNIGEKLAVRIVEFRETNGRFQRPEDLLLVPGISDKRFREIRHMIRTE
jgi:competence protein ComEA